MEALGWAHRSEAPTSMAAAISIGRNRNIEYGGFSFGAGSYHLPDFCESIFLVGHHGNQLEFDEVKNFVV